jgi:hypothetical protein
MIIINNERREKKELIATKFSEINIMHKEIEVLENELGQPVTWLEKTVKRIILDNEALVLLTINAKLLIDYLFESDITAEKVEGNTYVYVEYILPEHEVILLNYGAEIEINENI